MQIIESNDPIYLGLIGKVCSVRSNPEKERKAYLVLSDYLQERGDVRGEIIALHYRIEDLKSSGEPVPKKLQNKHLRLRRKSLRSMQEYLKEKYKGAITPIYSPRSKFHPQNEFDLTIDQRGFLSAVSYNSSPDALDKFVEEEGILAFCDRILIKSGYDDFVAALRGTSLSHFSAMHVQGRRRQAYQNRWTMPFGAVEELVHSGSLKDLKMLDYSHQDLGPIAILEIAKMVSIEELDLSSTEITLDQFTEIEIASGLNAIYGMPNLQSLKLDFIDVLGSFLEQGIDLSTNGLVSLSLVGSDIDNNALLATKELRELKHLDVSVNGEVTIKGLEAISNFPNLESLVCDSCGLKYNDLKRFQELIEKHPTLELKNVSAKHFLLYIEIDVDFADPKSFEQESPKKPVVGWLKPYSSSSSSSSSSGPAVSVPKGFKM